jgi:hypothetical protein
VKIVLQHVKTGLYLQGPGTWTKSLDEALDFGHSQRAIDYATTYRLSGVQMVVVFVDPDCVESISVAIPATHQAQAASRERPFNSREIHRSSGDRGGF